MELGVDVALAGYDDIDLAGHPIMSLTTVDQFGRRSGHAAVDLLMSRIQHGRSDARHEVIIPQLRIRSSTDGR